jgi:hypothetical protein
MKETSELNHSRVAHTEDKWLAPILRPQLLIVEGSRIPDNLNEKQGQPDRVAIGTVGAEEL